MPAPSTGSEVVAAATTAPLGWYVMPWTTIALRRTCSG
jgi:hypothetical protein